MATMIGSFGAGGRVVLGAPTMDRGASAGVFTITTGYDANYTYTLGGGPISRTGNSVTLSTTPSSGTVVQKAPKGVANSPARTIERTPITYYSCNCVMDGSYSVGGCCCPGGWNYEDYGWIKYCRHYSCSSCENAPPSGWLKTNGEWTRITP